MHEYGVNFQKGNKTLEAAIARGNLEMFYFLMDQNPVLGERELSAAVQYSINDDTDEDIAVEMINKLLDSGAEVNSGLLFDACPSCCPCDSYRLPGWRDDIWPLSSFSLKLAFF